MNRQVHVLLAAIAAICLAATTSIAAQVPLTPDSVIGGSSSKDGAWDITVEDGIFNGKHITDGSFREGTPKDDRSYWLAHDFNGPEYLVIDLGAQYNIDQIDLYNTNNRGLNDSYTNGFRIEASNSVVDNGSPTDFDLSGAATTIATGVVLKTDGEDPATTATEILFTPPTVPYQYLKFVAIDTDGFRVGLNEMEVFGSIVPEPSTLVLAALGLLGLMGFTRRRRRR